MAWFKVDDRFWSHPKTADLSDGATALWIRAGSWAAGHLTDGRVPVTMLRLFRARRRSADELVAAGLWSIAGDTFVFTSWDEYQPSKAQVEARREATKSRVTTWRDGKRNGVTGALRERNRNAPPDPTRPDPLTTPKGVAPRKRGTRIADPFIVTTDMRRWAATSAPAVDVDRSTEKFVNHWRAATGRNATALDWVAKWRNWLMNDADRNQSKPTPTQRAERTLRLATDLELKELE